MKYKLVKPFLNSPKKGSETIIFLATSPSVLKHKRGSFKKREIAAPWKATESEKLRPLFWQNCRVAKFPGDCAELDDLCSLKILDFFSYPNNNPAEGCRFGINSLNFPL